MGTILDHTLGEGLVEDGVKVVKALCPVLPREAAGEERKEKEDHDLRGLIGEELFLNSVLYRRVFFFSE
jgi:hypothetical protein